jgi:hypothetical protein
MSNIVRAHSASPTRQKYDPRRGAEEEKKEPRAMIWGIWTEIVEGYKNKQINIHC